jgi:hypothetical protein
MMIEELKSYKKCSTRNICSEDGLIRLADEDDRPNYTVEIYVKKIS